MEHNNSIIKKRKWKQLTERERYKIEGLFAAGMKPAEIAALIGCSKRTIEREKKLGAIELVDSHGTPKKNDPVYPVRLVYAADVAQRRHDENSTAKGRALKIGADHELARFIEKKIRDERWSPDAVIGYIKEKEMRFETSICTKTLYNYISNGLFLEISNKDLWYKKSVRKKNNKRARKVALNNRRGKGIEERPEKIEQRKEKGHWEIDLVIGKKGTKAVVLTMVERKSRRSVYVRSKDKTQKEVLKAIRKAGKRLKKDFGEIIKTITADNGSEFLDGAGIKEASGCQEV